MLSAFYALGFKDLTNLSKVLSYLALLFSMFLVWLLPGRLQNRPTHWGDFVGPIWLAWSPVTLIWTVSGLENAFFGALILLGVWFAVCARTQPRYWYLSSVCMVGVMYSRPEGLGYAFTIGLTALFILLIILSFLFAFATKRVLN